jgi:Arc/MetJ-type ribon-helix-helix transcriptional regulator
MARMVRKQIVIDAERDAQLGRLARKLGVSQSEVVRMAIDELGRQDEEETAKDQAFERLMKWFDEGRDLGLTDDQGRRTWTREELYERGSGRY